MEDRVEPEFQVVDGNVRFRINIPTVLAARKEYVRPDEPFGPRPGRIMREGHLDSYLRSAVGLAKIWNAIDSAENRNELRELVHLADKNNTISWSNFSFSPPRYSELLREVKKTNRHSMAVLVTVQELRALNDEWIKGSSVPSRVQPTKNEISESLRYCS